LLARLTLKPPLPAAVASVTVQVSLPDPVTDELLQESALNPAPITPALVVPFAPPLQPDIAMTTRQDASIVPKSARTPSSLQIRSSLQVRYEGITSGRLRLFARTRTKRRRDFIPGALFRRVVRLE
jgi:hypothetical protein